MTRTYRTTRITTVESISEPKSRRLDSGAGTIDVVAKGRGFVQMDVCAPAELANAFLIFHREYADAASALDRAKSFYR